LFEGFGAGVDELFDGLDNLADLGLGGLGFGVCVLHVADLCALDDGVVFVLPVVLGELLLYLFVGFLPLLPHTFLKLWEGELAVA
jgi:hypothetical protein